MMSQHLPTEHSTMIRMQGTQKLICRRPEGLQRVTTVRASQTVTPQMNSLVATQAQHQAPPHRSASLSHWITCSITSSTLTRSLIPRRARLSTSMSLLSCTTALSYHRVLRYKQNSTTRVAILWVFFYPHSVCHLIVCFD